MEQHNPTDFNINSENNSTNGTPPVAVDHDLSTPSAQKIIVGSVDIVDNDTKNSVPQASLGEKRPFKNIVIISSILFIFVLVILGVFIFSIQKISKKTNIKPSTPAPTTTNSVTKSVLNGIVLPFNLYVPQNMNWQTKPLLNVHEAKPENSILRYSVGGQYGHGLTRGAYDFYVYAQKGHFNPPNDCGTPGFELNPNQPNKCQAYTSNDNIKAYYAQRQAVPGGVQNTTVKSYITMYAAVDDTTVVCISSADTSAPELYGIIKSMNKISADELPKSSVILDGSLARQQLDENSKDLFSFAAAKNKQYQQFIPSYLENRSENTNKCSVFYTNKCSVNYSYLLNQLSGGKPPISTMKDKMISIYTNISSDGGWVTTDALNKPIDDAKALLLSKEYPPPVTLTKKFDNKYNVRIILSTDAASFYYEK